MPFTPFHFGPGLLAKSVFPRRFSFSCFAVAQVAIDVDPGYHILRREYPFHHWTHTYGGAVLIGLLTAVCAAPFLRICHRWWAEHDDSSYSGWLTAVQMSWPILLSSALIGTLSHVFLDSLMHPDVRPFLPITGANPFLGLVSVRALHLICVVTGAVALVYGLCVPLKPPHKQPERSRLPPD